MPDVFASALTKIYETFQDQDDPEIQDAIFIPETGDTVPCKIRIYEDDEPYPDGYSAQVLESEIIIEYQKADINRDAVRGETFTIGETIYTVGTIRSRDSVSFRVVVT